MSLPSDAEVDGVDRLAADDRVIIDLTANFVILLRTYSAMLRPLFWGKASNAYRNNLTLAQATTDFNANRRVTLDNNAKLETYIVGLIVKSPHGRQNGKG